MAAGARRKGTTLRVVKATGAPGMWGGERLKGATVAATEGEGSRW